MTQTYINNRYLLKHQLGAGGMGVVHLAQDRLTNEEVALKQIHVPAEKLQFVSRPDPEHVQDLQLSLAREFQSLASLRHPNIISVLDFGFDQERQPFFTMNYLSDAMPILSGDQQLSFKGKVTLIQQIFQALAYLHRREVLHRDIKPDNILVQNDHLRLLDFGLSRSDTEEQLSSSGGTLAYWPPENWLQKPYVASSDLFAAGIVMFELLTGQHPFGPVDSFLVDRVLDEEPNWDCLSGYENFRPIFEKLLHKSPEARYQDPHDLLSALGSLLGEPLSTENDEIREGYIQAASFVGREAELETLSQTLDQVKANDKKIWLVGGESGVGKSRLLEEIRIKALVSGWQVFRGQAVETGGLSFQIWQELIPQLVLGIELSDIEAGILKTFVPNLDQLLGRRIPEARVVDDASNLRR
ncbi:MAG: serine/threonine-protein kinase, partial [Chloroflexota bacterium]